ncbi:MAG: tRNA lysidine(34) synthetase TilS [Anaerolineales bacterium]
MTLLAHVRRFIEERDLLRPGATVVAGVSGGPDSLCLLDVLHRLDGAQVLGLRLHVAHLNHGLRPEAAQAAEFVRAEAATRGLTFHLEATDTRAHAAQHKLSLEEAARELRYSFLARVAAQVGASAIAVAHTADDQAETVLMRFLRGSGLAGLRGMFPKVGIRDLGITAWGINSPFSNSPTHIVRPLLFSTRADVEAYCAEHSLNPVHDASNSDTTFFRNRLRHELLPILETYNPNIRAVLARTAEVLTGEYEILQHTIEVLWREIARVEGASVVFERARWHALGIPEQRALLRRALQHLRPGLRDVDFAPLDAAVQFSRTAQTGRVCDVTGGLCLAIEYDSIVLRQWTPDFIRAEFAPADDVPQLNDAGGLSAGWKFHAEPVMQWTLDSLETDSSSRRVFVDAEAVNGPVMLRARRDGDRFQPLGMGGHSVKVSDFMINRKVPAALRDRWPLVVCGDEIVWVGGLRLDERFKVTPATLRVLKLKLTRSHS